MEYGYGITDTAGDKHFFVEGYTYCSMFTGGLHEPHCPYAKPENSIRTMDNMADRLGFYKR